MSVLVVCIIIVSCQRNNNSRAYIVWQMQNEMLKVMALDVIRDVAASLHSSPFYSIMADYDDTTGSHNREQVVTRLRWDSVNAHEEVIGQQ